MDNKNIEKISKILQATVVGGLGTAFVERILLPSVHRASLENKHLKK